MSQAVLVLVVFFGFSSIGLGWGRRRQFIPSSSAEAALQYRATMFLMIAYAESVPLIGFVLVFMVDSLTPYYIGFALGIPGFYLAAPTSSDLARRQEQLGPDVDLIGGLQGTVG